MGMSVTVFVAALKSANFRGKGVVPVEDMYPVVVSRAAKSERIDVLRGRFP